MAQTEAELLDNPVAGRPTLILRSPDFHSITEVVAEPLERATPIGWWLFFIPSLALLSLLGIAVSWLFWEGNGIWGLNVPVGWAWDITNFVFWVGSATPRSAHLGNPLSLPPAMAHLDQPVGGGDDHLRGDVRADVPGDSRRPRLGRLLDVPAPEPDGHVAQLPEPAPLGRIRGQHLRNGLGPLLVRGPDP